ncbi:hypothetical protein [Bradyrhizobium sp. CCGB12]|uniref:hypothetical protein n=1 Tax=Bradyrhizobium sp. CCGB12 TaxID=2949632 RepID=UPI0035C165BE
MIDTCPQLAKRIDLCVSEQRDLSAIGRIDRSTVLLFELDAAIVDEPRHPFPVR